MVMVRYKFGHIYKVCNISWRYKNVVPDDTQRISNFWLHGCLPKDKNMQISSSGEGVCKSLLNVGCYDYLK